VRLEDAETAAAAKLKQARALMAQYEDTITELSQDASMLTASAQALREDNSALSATLETTRAETDHLQAAPLCLPQPKLTHLQRRCNNLVLSGPGRTHIHYLS
jgi:chromosome segregation ATPase